MSDGTPPPGRTLAQKLDHLFLTIHPPDRDPYSYQEVEKGIREQAAEGGATVSGSAVQQIRTGVKTNPTINTLQAIAKFFGVPPSYFLDDAVADAVDARIQELKAGAERASAADELAQALEDSNVRAVAFRLAGLSTPTLKSIKTIVEQARRVEGLPDVAPPPRRPRR